MTISLVRSIGTSARVVIRSKSAAVHSRRIGGWLRPCSGGLLVVWGCGQVSGQVHDKLSVNDKVIS